MFTAVMTFEARVADANMISWSPSNIYSFDFGNIPIGAQVTISAAFTATVSCPCAGHDYIPNWEIEASPHSQDLPSPFSLEITPSQSSLMAASGWLVGPRDVTLGLDPTYLMTSTMTLLISFSFSPTTAGNYVISSDSLGNALDVEVFATPLREDLPLLLVGEAFDPPRYLLPWSVRVFPASSLQVLVYLLGGARAVCIEIKIGNYLPSAQSDLSSPHQTAAENTCNRAGNRPHPPWRQVHVDQDLHEPSVRSTSRSWERDAA
jgi:hypothetical protein